MPMPVTLASVAYATPDGTSLFSHLDLTFGARRTGLVGRNGTGKTTLLRLIAGELQPMSGSISRPERLGVLRQTVRSEDGTVLEALGAADAQALLDRIEAGSASADEFAEPDWTLSGRIATALAAVRLENTPERAMATLSGGQRTRVHLAALLLAEPEMILLDEPTNNLDADGRAAVADMLQAWRGAAIVVSHDRAVLRQMDAIVELTTLGAKIYGGNWDAYAERKAAELAASEQKLDATERSLQETGRKLQLLQERQAKRNAAGRKAAARGGVPKILLGGMKENAERTTAGQSNLASKLRDQAEADAAAARAEIEIQTPLSVVLTSTELPAGRTVLEASDLTGGPDGTDIITELDLKIVGPERVAVTGPNGSGKTTLLRLLTGLLPPSRGSVRLTERVAMLDQQVSLLDPSLSIRDNFRVINPAATENNCRAALARMMFRADAALQIVGSLSGGEMLRAALAATIGSNTPPELLILDEPTNHLDIHAIAAIEAGLRGYDGALLVVSHDRDFLAAIGVTREVAL